MLVLKRSEGQWTEIIHLASGDRIPFRVYDCERGRLQIAFDDPAFNFKIERPERDRIRTFFAEDDHA